MNEPFEAGREFIYREGRVLETRLLACQFEGAPAAGVIDALRAYQNDDGGFGHGLEPDKRCPASLPIDVESALLPMVAVGQGDAVMLNRACEFLARVADEVAAGGGVPLATPAIEGYPRAEHWTDWTYLPGLNPTAGLVGRLRQLGVEHPWVSRAADYCWAELEAEELPEDGHTLGEILIFLDQNPERERAERIAQAVASRLPQASHFRWDPLQEEYGITPLHLAPAPDSRWAALFAESQIDAHLDRLISQQQPDGGWPISWEPPSEAAILEWRGIETLRALRTLTAYRRIAPGR